MNKAFGVKVTSILEVKKEASKGQVDSKQSVVLQNNWKSKLFSSTTAKSNKHLSSIDVHKATKLKKKVNDKDMNHLIVSKGLVNQSVSETLTTIKLERHSSLNKIDENLKTIKFKKDVLDKDINDEPIEKVTSIEREFTDDNGNLFKGKFQNGVPYGEFMILYSNATAYYGYINKNGKPHGKGTINNSEGDIIEQGVFLNGCLQGIGKRFNSEGDCIEGEFQNGIAHGKFKITLSNGSIGYKNIDSLKKYTRFGKDNALGRTLKHENLTKMKPLLDTILEVSLDTDGTDEGLSK